VLQVAVPSPDGLLWISQRLRAAQGFNVTIFAYGQTGSGKTHTMTGDSESPGVATLAFSQIFSQIKETPQMRYNITLSIMEIYQVPCRAVLRSSSMLCCATAVPCRAVCKASH
jgi:hypothetical protein